MKKQKLLYNTRISNLAILNNIKKYANKIINYQLIQYKNLNNNLNHGLITQEFKINIMIYKHVKIKYKNIS